LQVIYVARNPKDAIVSLFYFHKLVNLCTYTGDLETFVDYFIENKGPSLFRIECR
jgi:sulfotransferase